MKKGDKYIIEIDDVMEAKNADGKPYQLARMKGFSSLVFDEHGLSMLEKCKDDEDLNQKSIESSLDCYFVVTAIDSNNCYLGVSGDLIKVGEILHVKNGKFTVRDGSMFPLSSHLTSGADLIDYMDNDFAGVKIAILQDYKEA